jgi:SAM-dependent methyltransferase
MGTIETDWFDPRHLFDSGYPPGLTSALRALPAVRTTVHDTIRTSGARTVLEIGPGDAPVASGLPGAVFMDVAPRFLANLAGQRVVADLFHAPFAPGTFDLVVASDVLTHVRPARRREALARIAELGRNVIVFNPEPGTAQVPDSPVPTRLVTAYLDEQGYKVESRKFVAMTPGGEYRMRLVIGRRS